MGNVTCKECGAFLGHFDEMPTIKTLCGDCQKKEQKESNVKILRITPDCEELIEYAYRKCYGSEMNELTRDEFIKGRIKAGHISVLEHAVVSFDILCVSRTCSHQIVRHRMASYSQRSQRYVKPSEEDFVIPNKEKLPKASVYAMVDSYKSAYDSYQCLLAQGVKPEDARYVLPEASSTSLVMTMNFSSLRHFFEMRISKKAQLEIRELAFEMLKQVYVYAPSVFQDQMLMAVDVMCKKGEAK